MRCTFHTTLARYGLAQCHPLGASIEFTHCTQQITLLGGNIAYCNSPGRDIVNPLFPTIVVTA